MLHNVDWGAVIVFLVFGLSGCGVFIEGVRRSWEYCRLGSCSVTPIRRISDGLVKVRGRAKSDTLLSGPISRIPCVFYKLVLEWDSGEGSETAIATDGKKFYINDGTGTAAVCALDNANIDLEKTGQCTFGQKSIAVGVGAFSIQLGKRIPVGTGEGFGNPELQRHAEQLKLDSFSRSYSVTEYCLRAEEECFVTGTCLEQPSAPEDRDRKVVLQGADAPKMIISYRGEKRAMKDLRRSAVLHLLGGAALALLCFVIVWGTLTGQIHWQPE